METKRDRERRYAKKFRDSGKAKAYKKIWLNTEKGKACNRRSSTNRYKKHKTLLDNFKAGKCCVDCGFNKWPECLDFHHIDPGEKEFTISQSLTKSWARTLKEIDKCILLCANCHRHKSKIQFETKEIDFRKRKSNKGYVEAHGRIQRIRIDSRTYKS